MIKTEMMKKILVALMCLLPILSFAQEVSEAESQKFMQMITPAQEKITKLNEEVTALTEEQRLDKAYTSDIQRRYNSYVEELGDSMLQYAREEPSSSISLEIIAQLVNAYDVNLIDSLYQSLTPQLKSSQLGLNVGNQITNLKKTPIGGMAPEFTQKNPNGKIVNLSDYRGKYVLIDFWASWCGPCRKENPHVVAAYKQFKDKNFDILGVSLDENHTSWTNAIRKDGLEWEQVSDLEGWKNKVAAQYGVVSIPQNVLVDPNGVIVAKNLRGEQLIKELEKLLK